MNTFSKGATEWISRYNENHFNTYALLVAAFLQRFCKEKSSSQLCSNIRELQQGRMDVEAYASKMLSMRQRVEEQLRPTIKQTTEWFINGLKPECHASVNTENAETEEEFDAIVEKAKIAERREQEKKRTRRKREKASAQEETFGSSESSSSESEKEDKKKSKKQGKVRKSDALGEMQTLLEELKKAKNEVVRRNMFCSQCRMEGHVKEECTTPPTCAICEMYNHSTSNCRYNMRNRAAAVNQVEAQAAQETPIQQNRGRGRFRGRGMLREQYRERPGITCYYCQVSGHTSRDCPLRIRHQAEKQAEVEKSRNNPADVQMISMDEERSQVTKMLSGLTKVLTITRAQAKKRPQENIQKEMSLKNSWEEQRQVRDQAQGIIEKQQKKKEKAVPSKNPITYTGPEMPGEPSQRLEHTYTGPEMPGEPSQRLEHNYTGPEMPGEPSQRLSTIIQGLRCPESQVKDLSTIIQGLRCPERSQRPSYKD